MTGSGIVPMNDATVWNPSKWIKIISTNVGGFENAIALTNPASLATLDGQIGNKDAFANSTCIILPTGAKIEIVIS